MNLMEDFLFKVGLKTDVIEDVPEEEIPQLHNKNTAAEFDNELDYSSLSVSSLMSNFVFSDLTTEEGDRIRSYRRIANLPEVDHAIDEITNEAIVIDNDDDESVKIDFLKGHEKDLPENIKKDVVEEFHYLLKLLDFRNKGANYFENWYIDSRIIFGIGVEKTNPKKGITSLKFLDPLNVKKVYHVDEDKHYYIYTDNLKRDVIQKLNRINTKKFQQYQDKLISADLIAVAPSGIVDKDTKDTISYLDRAIKPINQLRLLEDSLVIYRIVRAPERRVFQIDTGRMPKTRAEQYMAKTIQQIRNKQIYDMDSGNIKTKNAVLSMIEDIFLPRTADGKGSSVDTLQGGANLSEMDDVYYFLKKVYNALHIPESRIKLEESSPFNIGRSGEITRDEINFYKFIVKIRQKFSMLFLELLERQLAFKKIVNSKDFKKIKYYIKFEFSTDNYYDEFKKMEIINARIENLQVIEPYIGKFFTEEEVARDVLKMTADEWKKKKKLIEKENIVIDSTDTPEEIEDTQPEKETQTKPPKKKDENETEEEVEETK